MQPERTADPGRRRVMRSLMGLGIALALIVVPAMAAPDKGAAGKDELKAIEGTWELIEHETNGKDDGYVGHTLTIKGGEFTLQIKDGPTVTGTVAVTAGKDFHKVDVTVVDGDGKETKLLGIHRIKDGRMETCFANAGTDRPTDFTTKPGDNRYREVWKRVKQ